MQLESKRIEQGSTDYYMYDMGGCNVLYASSSDTRCSRCYIMNAKLQETIDLMEYKDMLAVQRFADDSSRYFKDEVKTYFLKVMREKRMKITNLAYVLISNKIGWSR